MSQVFVEATGFTREIVRLGLEEDLRHLQWSLRARPDAGVVERGTGGLRKIRMGSHARGVGKRGGLRIHYLHVTHSNVIYLLSVYRKSERSSLSAQDRRMLRQLVAVLNGASTNAPR